MKITIAAFSPCADETIAGELEQLMYFYCSEFPKLYPTVSIKPKNALHASFTQANNSFLDLCGIKIQCGLKLNMGGSRIIGGKKLHKPPIFFGRETLANCIWHTT